MCTYYERYTRKVEVPASPWPSGIISLKRSKEAKRNHGRSERIRENKQKKSKKGPKEKQNISQWRRRGIHILNGMCNLMEIFMSACRHHEEKISGLAICCRSWRWRWTSWTIPWMNHDCQLFLSRPIAKEQRDTLIIYLLTQTETKRNGRRRDTGTQIHRSAHAHERKRITTRITRHPPPPAKTSRKNPELWWDL